MQRSASRAALSSDPRLTRQPPTGEAFGPASRGECMNAIARGLLGVFLLFAVFHDAFAASSIVRELPPGLVVPDAARPGPNFDVDRATEAYLDLLSPEQRELSNAYFEGGYWLQLWGVLYGLAVAALLLWTGVSQRMRDIGRRMTRRVWLQTLIYAFLWVLV